MKLVSFRTRRHDKPAEENYNKKLVRYVLKFYSEEKFSSRNKIVFLNLQSILLT